MTIPNVKKTSNPGGDVPEHTGRVPYVTGPRNFLDNERIAARQAR